MRRIEETGINRNLMIYDDGKGIKRGLNNIAKLIKLIDKLSNEIEANIATIQDRIKNFGENEAQDFLDPHEDLPHYNKAKKICDEVLDYQKEIQEVYITAIRDLLSLIEDNHLS